MHEHCALDWRMAGRSLVSLVVEMRWTSQRCLLVILVLNLLLFRVNRKCLLIYVCWAKQTHQSFCVASHQRKLVLFQAPVEVLCWFFNDLSHCISISSYWWGMWSQTQIFPFYRKAWPFEKLIWFQTAGEVCNMKLHSCVSERRIKLC